MAINGCDGDQAQDWATWSDGTVRAWNLCMDTSGSHVGALAELEDCDGAASQVWTPQSNGSLVNSGSGLCLEDPGGTTTAGTQLDLHTCNGAADQQWTLPPAPPGGTPPLPANASVCDIYASGGTPCVAAYSMTRAMYVGYDGPLYQVKRASDGATKDIGLLAAGGDVNASQQDSFCAGTSCTITEIYDQSPDGNNLTIEQSGGNASADQGAAADALPIKIGGNEAYGLDIEQGTGYRDDTTTGVATGSAPESMYMVASGTHVNYGCCFDFGNVETDNDDHGAGTMDAVNLTTWCGNNNTFPCSGGPWVEADLENGQYTGSGPNVEPASSSDFVTAMLSNNGQNTSSGLNSFELQGGNSQSGGLTTFYNGSLPSGYSPMKKQGAIVLGTGGDNSNTDVGSFFEGVMTVGYPTDAADAAVQANIVAAGYSGSTNPVASEAPSAAGQAVVHDGYSSVYTVDSANGDLEESYLPAMGDSWSKQDLSVKYGTPAVMPGTQPVAVFHCGYTSVYTVDAATGDLQETYLPAAGFPGDGWLTQDLSSTGGTTPGTPPTNVTPTAVVHDAGAGAGSAGCDGYTSVYSVDRNGDLQETYLPNQGFPGDAWHTQDLSGTGGTLPGTPQANSTPTAVVHDAGAGTGSTGCDGYTSVYTVDQGSQDLQETYLPNQGFPGDDWHTQNLSAKYQAPPVAPGTQPEALVHMGFTSVYTIDEGSDQVQETYLSAIGGGWLTQSLSAKYQAPTTDQSPIVLLHQDTSGVLDWTSVFTVDEFNAHLQETYLPNAGFPGDSWATQDLSAKYGTPPVYELQSSPASWSVAHGGYTSVYTGNSSGDLEETYLPAMGDGWTTQNLSSTGGNLPGTPLMLAGTTPVALVHDGYTSVYTIDAGDSAHTKGDLQETYLPAIGGPWYTQDLSHLAGTPASKASPTAVFHDGYVSVYTADGSDGDLWETYLPGAGFPGDSWQSQNLTAKYHTPPVDAFTSPVAIVHDGYTSVYTVDTTNAADGSTLGDLQETYLPYMGDGWFTQNLSVKYGTPLVNILTSPTAVFHNGYTSVYTVGASNGHLSETYLPAMGDTWSTQDLTSETSGNPVAYGVQPVAVYHTGYISVYTVDASNGHLRETYLTAIGGSWATQDLYPSAGSQVVAPFPSPSAVVHYDTSGGLTFTSVFTVDYSSGDVRETYLPVMGDLWSTQDLTAKYHTPAV